MITIIVQGNEEIYEVLRVIDFTSDRKKMSVIVRGPNGKVTNFIKGADMAICKSIPQELLKEEKTQFMIEKMDEFAREGLRTLMFCKKDLDDSLTAENLK